MNDHTREKLTVDETMKTRLDGLVRKLSKKYSIKGTSVIVVNNEKMVYRKHHGVVDAFKTKNNASRKMMIGSTTKLLTALGILILKDRGKLSLDEDIKAYIPEFMIRSHFKEEYTITPMMLLMHVSGLPSDDYDLITRKDKTLEDIIDSLKDTYLCAPPNTMNAYSNLGYGLLGLIIERISGVSYETFIKENILDKLGLSFEFLKNSEQLKEREKAISQGFDSAGNVKEDPLGTIISGGAFTYGTIDDLGKFLQFFLNYENQKILQPKTMKLLMEHPKGEWISDEEVTVGLGLMHNLRHFFDDKISAVQGHGGNTIYHHSTFEFMLKEGFGVAVMTNSAKGGAMSRDLTLKIIIECLKALGHTMPKKPRTHKISKSYNHLFKAQDYVAAGLKIPCKVDKKGNSIYKFSFAKFQVLENEDGYFETLPVGLSKLFLFKKSIKNLRLKPTIRDGKDVLYMEQSFDYFKRALPIATKYESPKDYQQWKDACHHYRIINENSALKRLFDSAKLMYDKGDLILETKMMGSKTKYYLFPISDKMAIIQGYGRGTKDTITLNSDKESDYLSLMGIELRSTN